MSRHRRKRRVHFHEFMREIHARMRGLSGQEDPLDIISTEIARELRLLAFDKQPRVKSACFNEPTNGAAAMPGSE